MATDFLEKTLEDIIYETDNTQLRNRGLYIYGKKLRQVSIGNYGKADLITIQRAPYGESIFVTVYEMKKGEINADAFLQAARYVRGIQRYLKIKRPNRKYHVKFDIALVGYKVSNGDFCYIPDAISDVTLFTYKYSFDGISFNVEDSFYLTNEGF